MGVGAGLADRQARPHGVGGVSYLDFLAPGPAGGHRACRSGRTTPCTRSWAPSSGSAPTSPCWPRRCTGRRRPLGHLAWMAARLAIVCHSTWRSWPPSASSVAPGRAGPAGRRPDRHGLRRPDRRFRRHPAEGPGLHHRVPLRPHPALPVLGDVLPREPAARVAPAGGLRHPALPRGGSVPGAGAGNTSRSGEAWATPPTWWVSLPSVSCGPVEPLPHGWSCDLPPGAQRGRRRRGGRGPGSATRRGVRAAHHAGRRLREPTVPAHLRAQRHGLPTGMDLPRLGLLRAVLLPALHRDRSQHTGGTARHQRS